MSLDISCSQCGKQYKVPDNAAGRKARCKACDNVMTIPLAEESLDSFGELQPMGSNGLLDELPAEPESSLKPLAPVKSKAGGRSTNTSQRKITIAKPDPSEKRGGWALTLLVIGGALLFIGYREWRLSSHADSTPQKITLAELAANGPGDNIYLELSGVRLLPELSVIETESRNFGPEKWSYVWVPAVPNEWTEDPQLNQVKVIVGVKGVKDEKELLKYCHKRKLEGLIVNITDSVDSEARELLNEGLSGIDSGSCYFFRAGQKPASGKTQALLLGGGFLALLAGLGVGGLELWSRTGS